MLLERWQAHSNQSHLQSDLQERTQNSMRSNEELHNRETKPWKTVLKSVKPTLRFLVSPQTGWTLELLTGLGRQKGKCNPRRHRSLSYSTIHCCMCLLASCQLYFALATHLPGLDQCSVFAQHGKLCWKAGNSLVALPISVLPHRITRNKVQSWKSLVLTYHNTVSSVTILYFSPRCRCLHWQIRLDLYLQKLHLLKFHYFTCYYWFACIWVYRLAYVSSEIKKIRAFFFSGTATAIISPFCPAFVF